MKKLDKLEAMAEKKREKIKIKQDALKKDMDNLKDIEAEIEILKGEEFRRDINKLNLTSEEFEKFRKCVLSDRNNLLDIINMMSEEKIKQQEGDAPIYE